MIRFDRDAMPLNRRSLLQGSLAAAGRTLGDELAFGNLTVDQAAQQVVEQGTALLQST
jgi:hypothetical protein